MLRVPLNQDYFIEGDSLQFFIVRKIKERNSIEANCATLTSIASAWCRLSPQTCADLDAIVAKDAEVDTAIRALLHHKQVARVDLDGKYFIEFDKDALCLESIRPERVDKSKNHGFFSKWNLDYAVITYKNRVLMHCDATTKEQVIAQLDATLASIREAFSKVALVDQGKPWVGLSRDIKCPKADTSSDTPRVKCKFQ